MAHLMACAECSAAFTATRSDAETCGPACRAARYRRNRDRRDAEAAARQAAEIERVTALLASLAAAAGLTPEDGARLHGADAGPEACRGAGRGSEG